MSLICILCNGTWSQKSREWGQNEMKKRRRANKIQTHEKERKGVRNEMEPSCCIAYVLCNGPSVQEPKRKETGSQPSMRHKSGDHNAFGHNSHGIGCSYSTGICWCTKMFTGKMRGNTKKRKWEGLCCLLISLWFTVKTAFFFIQHCS